MNVPELFDAIRAAYVGQFSRVAAEHSAHIEPAYRLADGSLAIEGVLALPCRADLILKEGDLAGHSISVDSSVQHQFEEIHFQIGTTMISLSPFAWDWVAIGVRTADVPASTLALQDWFLKWFDKEDSNAKSPDGLYGVVHFLSDPETVSTGLKVHLDLGSAPSGALEELLFRLSDGGASEVIVGQAN